MCETGFMRNTYMIIEVLKYFFCPVDYKDEPVFVIISYVSWK